MEETSASPSSPMAYENPDATPRKCKRTAPSTACYQVFINHRGPDIKKTLASVIHHRLQSKGLRVFLDKDEFQPGQPLKSTIEDAVRTSSVHIAIFSEGYAGSDWCLKELCLMLETRAPIIPAFYDVRPVDLRWIEKGEYASAFEEHKKEGTVDSETIFAWKSALKRVFYVSGLDLNDPNMLDRDEGQLLNSLEDAVFQIWEPVPLEVATCAVGLDEAKVKIVGIGGFGKTTLAKEYFNRRRSLFGGSNFLFGSRDASNGNELPGLQRKLLKALQRDYQREAAIFDSSCAYCIR